MKKILSLMLVSILLAACEPPTPHPNPQPEPTPTPSPVPPVEPTPTPLPAPEPVPTPTPPTTQPMPVEEDPIYVSPDGSDANSGLSPDKAVKSISVANSKLASHKSLLFKRGGTYTGVLGRWRTTAYSNKKIGAYGEGALPVIKTEGKPIIDMIDKIVIKNVVFENLVVDNGGSKGSLFRWLGGSENNTIQNCHFLSGGLILQDYNKLGLKNWTIKNSTIKNAWNIAGQSHSQGLYTDHVDGLVVENNVFDHNGWNESQTGGEATMYNHNMYLSSSSNIVIRNNKILNASSMGIKFRSDVAGGSKNILVENNYFQHGEIGIGIGGNVKGPDRFTDVKILNNTFDAIGATNPTKRSFSWGIGIAGVTNGLFEGNKFVNAPNFSNKYEIKQEDNTSKNITVR